MKDLMDIAHCRNGKILRKENFEEVLRMTTGGRHLPSFWEPGFRPRIECGASLHAQE